MAASLQSLIDKIKEQINQQSPFVFNSNLVNTLKQRLPKLSEDKLEMLSTVGQAIDLNKLTQEELILLSNLSLEELVYCENISSFSPPFSYSNPAFDLAGNILSEDFSKVELNLAFKRALATNKSLSQSFILNYISNLG